MKIRRKRLDVRNDCFDAEEKDLRLKVESFRNEVNVTIWQGKDPWAEATAYTLPELVKKLLKK